MITIPGQAQPGPLYSMLSFEDYVACDLVGWADRIRAGEVSAAEVLDAAIDRAEAVNPEVNALVERLYDAARADLAAGRGSDRPFAGAPFVVKDLYPSIAGVRFTNGSRAFDGITADVDSELVRRFRSAGLTLMATSTSPELAVAAVTESTLHGATRNPWDLSRTSGGSSGGASALVAAGVVPAAHATDGGGSIRGPASCCGLVGLKPSRGRVPMAAGRTEGWLGCSTSHAVTRSVRDCAALLDATHGAEPGSRYVAPPPTGTFAAAAARDPGPLRIALHWETAPGIVADPECVRAAEAAGRLCEELGHMVELAAPSLDREALGRAFGSGVLSSIALAVQGRAQALGVDEAAVLAQMEETNREYVVYAKRFTAVQLLAANDAFMTAAIRMAQFQEAYDIVLTPTMARPPLPVGEGALMQPAAAFDRATSAFSGFTAIYNQTGQPAVSAPLHMSPEGLPIGVQFAARLGEEELLLSLLGQLERAHPWFNRRPAL